MRNNHVTLRNELVKVWFAANSFKIAFGVGLFKSVILKVYFTFFTYKPKFRQFFPNKDHMIFAKLHISYCEETIDDSEPNRLFIISVTAVRAACTCKLLRLLPDRCMVCLIIWLVIAASPLYRQQQMLQHLKNGVPLGSDVAPLLLNIIIYNLTVTYR